MSGDNHQADDLFECEGAVDDLDINLVIDGCIDFINRFGQADCAQFALAMHEIHGQAIDLTTANKADTVRFVLELVGNHCYQISVSIAQGSNISVPAVRPSGEKTRPYHKAVGLSVIKAYAGFYEIQKDTIVARFSILPLAKEFPIQGDRSCTTISPQCDLISPFADKFRKVVLGLVAGECIRFVFDLAAVTMIDSACLSVLIAFNKRITEKNPAASIEIINVSPSAQTLFDLTGLSRVFTIT
jgi:anti-anti-sigma factor